MNKEDWIRTCQECGHQQVDTRPDPTKPLTDAYRDRKCKRCKSKGLDYGSYKSNPDNED